MTIQVQIPFPTESPINQKRLTKQSREIFEYLMTGKSINRYEAGRLFQVGNLHSRIPEIGKALKVFGVQVKREFITVKGFYGEDATVRKYWLDPKDIEKLSEQQSKMAA